MKLSVVTPIYNEEGSVVEFLAELLGVLKGLGESFEIIAVDDGSRDSSWVKMKEFAKVHGEVKIISLQSNSGQTAALSAGINSASGAVIVLIDSDMENDPTDIPKLLAKLDEGNDVVSGWRQGRWHGATLTRRWPSEMANWLIKKVTGLPLHDFGCTLKAYRAEVIKGINLYGEMHRFIPAYAKLRGAKVVEIVVNHRPRKAGVSKYGLSRTYKVLLDLVVLKFLDKYMSKPMHFFGGIGFISLALGFLAGFVAVVLRIFDVVDLVETPLPVFSALFIIVGILMIVMGILAEMMMRTYFETQHKTPYNIAEKINF